MTPKAIPKRYKRTPTIYVVGDVAFVANPSTRSAWWKTHASVAVAACPTCAAKVGHLCVPSFGFCHGRTHSARRRLLPRGERIAMRVVIAERRPRQKGRA